MLGVYRMTPMYLTTPSPVSLSNFPFPPGDSTHVSSCRHLRPHQDSWLAFSSSSQYSSLINLSIHPYLCILHSEKNVKIREYTNYFFWLLGRCHKRKPSLSEVPWKTEGQIFGFIKRRLFFLRPTY